MERNKPYNELPDLPPDFDLEKPELLKASLKASRLLAELKGSCQRLPDPKLLINTLVLQESKDSSAIENIVTTQDELYKAVIAAETEMKDSNAKEVLLYREAIYEGLNLMKERGLTTNTIVSIMQKLKNTTAGIRTTPGTKLANHVTKEIIYTPPEGENLIREKLKSLEKYIHNHKDETDPLIKMALIHYQFEAIHPFTDGNGRTGRIINVLYLVDKNLLTLPVLYLSSFIIDNKSQYYKLLRSVTEQNTWKEWILFMLKAVSETAGLTLEKISRIDKLKSEITDKLRNEYFYNRDLIDLIFTFPYVKINTLERNGIAKRQTASAYLKKLSVKGILRPHKIGKEIYFINHRLMEIISK